MVDYDPQDLTRFTAEERAWLKRKPKWKTHTAQQLRIARRRSNIMLKTLAQCYGVSRVSFLKYERDADRKLIRFWAEMYGLRFTEPARAAPAARPPARRTHRSAPQA